MFQRGCITHYFLEAGDPEPSNKSEPRPPLKPLSFGPFDLESNPSRVDVEDFGDEKGSFDWREPKFTRLSDPTIENPEHRGAQLHELEVSNGEELGTR